ncbi:MAG: FAD binding domain-containing protein [Proteobacteria bacterium]|nr:FAD binding domain-containing protein [Pseudomonadota bacterium]
MKAAAFEYVRPRDVGDAVAALAGTAGAKLLAGGQSLGPMLNLRLARPKLLVDIARIDALRRIEDAGDAWRIGGVVTHAEIEDAPALRGTMLAEVAAGIAYRAVRNRGTIGGSLAHADPAADWPLALAALDATVVLRGRSGERRVPADGLMTSAFTTGLRDDDIVEAVLVTKLSGAARFGYFKFCRKTGEFPEASAAAVLDPERKLARLFVGALSGAPQPLPGLARALAEHGAAAATPDAVAAALATAAAGLDAVERRMHAGTVLRALRRLGA